MKDQRMYQNKFTLNQISYQEFKKNKNINAKNIVLQNYSNQQKEKKNFAKDLHEKKEKER